MIRWSLVVLVLLLFVQVPAHCASARSTAADRQERMLFEGRVRQWQVHLPPAYDGVHPLPLVVFFHGGLSNVREIVKMCGMSREADRSSFIVVYPYGTGRARKWLGWDVGAGWSYASRKHVDDMGFVEAMLERIKQEYCIDRTRIYAAGFSEGGTLAMKIAVKHPRTFAAVAAVSGWLNPEDCTATAATPVLLVHGTKDRAVPPSGRDGKYRFAGVHLHALPFKGTIAYWIRQNKCHLVGYRRWSDLEHALFFQGKDHSAVSVYLIRGYGHAWPGGPPTGVFSPKPYPYLPTAQVIWRFFNNYASAAAARTPA